MLDALTKICTSELLSDLTQQGVQLWIEHDKLRIRSPKGVLTQPLQDELALHKPAILEILREQQASADSLWISRPKPNPDAQLRLFCFPFAGGGGSTYRSWVNFLPQEVELCIVQLPGRENRLNDTPFFQFDDLLDTLVIAIQPYLDKPFAFYGHSLGALLSFALAHELARLVNRQPTHLFVSACTAPHLPRRLKQRPNLKLNFQNYVRLVKWLHPWISTKVWLDLIFHPLSHPAVIEKFLRPFGLDAPQVLLQNSEFLNRILPTIKADFLLADSYTYQDTSPLDCPLSVFGGEEDKICDRSSLEAWCQHTHRDFKLALFPGGHLFLREAGRKPLLTFIAQALSKSLKT